jgi:hypothetical protein
MPRGTYFSCFAKKSKQKKATLVSARATPVPSLRTIGKAAGFNKTEPAESPLPLVPRSARYKGAQAPAQRSRNYFDVLPVRHC